MKMIISAVFFLAVSFTSVQAKTRILMIGDSLTAGYGIAKKDAYPKLVETILREKEADLEVINAGTSGSTSASAPSRLKWHLKKKPDFLLLALGANDGLRGLKNKNTRQNLEKAILMAKKADIFVFLAGMKLPLNYGEKYRKEFEDIFTGLAKKHKVKLIPFLLEGVGGIKKLNLPDGIHPNEEGHKIMAKNVAKYIQAEL